MSSLLTHRDNRRYLNDQIIPFKGKYIYSDTGTIEQRYLLLYRIDCIPTGEVYIGQRSCLQNCKDPMLDRYKGSGHKLRLRKQQYNWLTDFKYTILKFCNDTNELDREEAKLVEQYINQYGEKCLNLKSDVTTPRLENKKPSHECNRITNLTEFVSPLTGKYYPAHTIFENSYSLSFELGFKSKLQARSAILSNQYGHKGVWCAVYHGMHRIVVTKFVYEDQYSEQLVQQFKQQYKDQLPHSMSICKRVYQSKANGGPNIWTNLTPFYWEPTNTLYEVGELRGTTLEIGRILNLSNVAMFSSKLIDYGGELWTNIPGTNKTRFITKFKLLVEIDDISKSGLTKLYDDQYRDEIEKEIVRKNRPRNPSPKRVMVLTSFISPYNGRIFESGTIFKSIISGSRSIGFASNQLQSILGKNNGHWKVDNQVVEFKKV